MCIIITGCGLVWMFFPSLKSLPFYLSRMPAILDGDEAVRKWLDFTEVPTEEALHLIQPTENIAFHPVSTIVNNSRNNSLECILPIELDPKKVCLHFLF